MVVKRQVELILGQQGPGELPTGGEGRDLSVWRVAAQGAAGWRGEATTSGSGRPRPKKKRREGGRPRAIVL